MMISDAGLYTGHCHTPHPLPTGRCKRLTEKKIHYLCCKAAAALSNDKTQQRTTAGNLIRNRK